jgi:hypothetical protein
LLRLSETLFERGADLAKLRRYLSEKVRVTDCWRTMETAISDSSESPFLAWQTKRTDEQGRGWT